VKKAALKEKKKWWEAILQGGCIIFATSACNPCIMQATLPYTVHQSNPYWEKGNFLLVVLQHLDFLFIRYFCTAMNTIIISNSIQKNI